MENASKALIIAATTILGILLLSVMVYMFRAAAKVDEQYDTNQSQRSLEQENSQFEVYNNNYNTIMDLISVANLAYNNNVQYDYDSASSIEINIKIGSKTYTIPKTNPDTTNNSNDSDYNTTRVDSYGKNRIWINGKAISIYDLANKSLKDLGISATSTDKLTKTHYGIISYSYDKDGKYMEGTVSKSARVYKYIFKCEPDKITYNNKTGKITGMTFSINDSIATTSELYWNPSWDD
jgi:type II secretory pathway pseudopilin PulG